MKNFGRVMVILFTGLVLSSCASLFGITDLTEIDFKQVEFRLNQSSVNPDGSYILTARAYDVEKNKIRDMYFNDQVRIDGQFFTSKVSGTKVTIKVEKSSIALLEQGELRITLTNAVNGTTKDVVVPVIWQAASINLEAQADKNGAVATYSIAILDTSKLVRPQGDMLLIRNQSTGLVDLYAMPLTINANGSNGKNGRNGRDGGLARIASTGQNGRGENGSNGENGENGGNGGIITLEGSGRAIAAVNVNTLPGKGGKGGLAGKGAAGAERDISLNEFLDNYDDVEWIASSGTTIRLPADLPPSARRAFYQTYAVRVENNQSLRAKFKSGKNGKAGRNGKDGMPGQVIKTEKAINKDDFSNTLVRSKNLTKDNLK